MTSDRDRRMLQGAAGGEGRMLDETIDKSFCEFFAGIGLVHEALRRTGWHCAYANDIDAKKRRMYAGHYGAAASEHYHEADVWAAEDVLARIPGRPFLATASFPCTDMSLAGKRRGLQGEQSGALFGFLQVLERLEERRPSVVLLENVPGFLTSHGGADFTTAIEELASLGYWLDSFVIDAQWFVPQSRPRLFLVGYQCELLGATAGLPSSGRRVPASHCWRASSGAPQFRSVGPLIVKDDVDDPLANPWQRAINRADRLRPARLRAAMETIQPTTGWATIDCGNPAIKRPPLLDFIDVGDDRAWWNAVEVQRHFDMMFQRHRSQIETLRTQGGSAAALTGFRRVRDGKQRLEVRFDGLAGCLRTPRGGSAKQIVIVVHRGDVRLRWMTPREYARLQGAADYTLPENTIQALFGFGDAVCVPVIQWIDQHMLTPVFEAVRVQGSENEEVEIAMPAT